MKKTFYITAPWLPGKAIVASGTSPLDALTSVAITVWEKDKWEEIKNIPDMSKIEEIDYR